MICDPTDPAASPAIRRICGHLRWFPFAFILTLITYAYLTLTVSLAAIYTIAKQGRIAQGLVQLVVSTALAGGAIWSFLVAVFKNPGVPHSTNSRLEQGSYPEEQPRSRRRQSGSEYELQADEGSASAPLLSAPIPGQPQLPSRTGREQLEDLYALGKSVVPASDIWVKSSGESRWCAKCAAPKPDRCHHCSSCRRCVLRMDHHCPWLASRCIGLRNHKPFFLFLMYTSLFCLYALQETARALLAFVENEPDGFESSPIAWAIVLFMGFIFGLTLSPFAAYHAWLICKNRTTIESMEGSGRVRLRAARDPERPRVEDRLRRIAGRTEETPPPVTSSGVWRSDEHLTREERRALRKASKYNVYDIGFRANWRQIMGKNWLQWWIPLGEPEGDGVSYLVNTQTLRKLEELTESIRVKDGPPADPRDRDDDRPARDASWTGADSDSVSSGQDERRPHDWRQKGRRFQGAHGEMEWGDAPRRSEWGVPFGVGSDSEDDGPSVV